MKRPRMSIGGLIAAVAAVAVNIAVTRSFYATSYTSDSAFVYSCGFLPMASLLILVAVLSTPSLLRGGRLSPFVFGFETVGWAVVFAFISWYAVATDGFIGCIEAIERVVGSEPRALAVLVPSPFEGDPAPTCAQVSAALGFAIALFSLPQLLLALLGASLARRWDLTVRFQRRGTTDVRTKLGAKDGMMARSRASIAGMMAAVAAVAVNAAVMRLVYAAGSSRFAFIYACGVLPMASLLILVAVVSIPSLLRGGWLSPFLVGFEAVGWSVVFAFISWYCVDEMGIFDCTQAIATFVGGEPGISALFLDGPPDLEPPNRIEAAIEFGFSTGLYSLPQLVLAMLGGWLARKLGLTARFEHWGTPKELRSTGSMRPSTIST
jgi:hypothetical protein